MLQIQSWKLRADGWEIESWWLTAAVFLERADSCAVFQQICLVSISVRVSYTAWVLLSIISLHYFDMLVLCYVILHCKNKVVKLSCIVTGVHYKKQWRSLQCTSLCCSEIFMQWRSLQKLVMFTTLYFTTLCWNCHVVTLTTKVVMFTTLYFFTEIAHACSKVFVHECITAGVHYIVFQNRKVWCC